jgi:molecular chaperone GrpE
MAESEPPDFDAVAAAKELDDLLGDARPADESAAEQSEYIANLEAEIEAATKRIASASAKDLEQRTRKILEGFLPIVDDLERGIAAARQHAESADVVEGLELVRRSMLSRLGQFGVTHLPALGETFDPQRHDAVALVPVTDPAQDGRVIDVMREGYLIGDETLRPASVAVGRRG